MSSIAFGLLAFGFVALCVGLVGMFAPRIDEFFASVAADFSGDVVSNVGTEGFGE